VKRFAISVVVLLAATTLTACSNLTVYSNTNPAGTKGVPCFIRLVDDQGKVSEPINKSEQTCKDCQVGDSYPDCMKQRKEEPTRKPDPNPTPAPDPADTPVPGHEAEGGKALILRLIGRSTSAPFNWSAVVTNAAGKEGDLAAWVSNDIDDEKTLPVTTTDRTVIVKVTARETTTSVTCQILGPGRAVWAEETASKSVTCTVNVREEVRKRGLG
jgi:hypothetical protein